MASPKLCECCDLPTESCGKNAEVAQADAVRAARLRALAEPGTVAANFPGTCACGDRYPTGTPIRYHPDGWYDAVSHPEGLDA